MKMWPILALFFITPNAYAFEIDPLKPLQEQLTKCSDRNLTCVINDRIEVNETLFLWGDATLKGGGELVFNTDNIDEPYLLNIGISGKSNGVILNNKAEHPFTGKIKDLTFTINSTNGEQGRLIYFWRTKNAEIKNNTFNLGASRYSATTSGNHNGWLSGIQNYIRKDITISGNEIYAQGTNRGSEGIGLGSFDGALIENNLIIGVGDDPIGVHYSKNIKILNNEIESVDGRIFVSNGLNVEIAHNKHTRIASLQDGQFYQGIALIYAGFEIVRKNSFRAPENYHIHHNELYYSEGSIDGGAAINLKGIRDVVVENNYIENNSILSATAIHILPQPMSEWTDPTGIDGSVARVHNVELLRNIATDQRIIMTGNCVDYRASPLVERNIATGYQFYCGAELENNRTVN